MSARRKSKGRSWLLIGLLIAAGFGAWRLWPPAAPPPPPAVDTTGFDPLIAEALERARQAVLDSPRSADARGKLGMVLLAHQMRAPACHCFAQASALAPREPRWPYFLGVAHLLDNPMTAVTNLDRAVRLFPETAAAPRLKLAATLVGLGQLEAAEAHYRLVLRQAPNSAPAALGLGKIANARDDPAAAAGFLEAALRDPATRKAAHRLLVNVNQRLGRTNEAGRLAQTLARMPNDIAAPDPFLAEVEQLKTGEHAWIDLGDEWIKTGRVAEAARLLEQTVRTYPNSDRARFFLGRARLRLGDAEGAEKILLEAVALAPASIEAQMQLGVTRLNRGRPKEAEPCFRAAIQAKPNLAPAWYNLALSQGEDVGRRAESLAAFREAIRLKPDLVEAYFGLALVLQAEGQPQAAAVELRRALTLEPDEPLRQRLLDLLRLVERR